MILKEKYPSRVWRHCPYCGATNIEWTNGAHSMRCANCNQQFYINAAAAVVAIIYNEAGELLLTRRKRDPVKGTLDLPGGFVDLGEKAEAAVIRETKEELNLDVKDVRYFGSMPNRYLFGSIVYFTLDLVFECTIKTFDILTVADDVSDYIFKHPKDIELNEVGLESIRRVIQQLKRKA